MPGQPSANLGLLVGRILVEDDVNFLVGGHFGLDDIQEADELLVLVALPVVAECRAVVSIRRRPRQLNFGGSRLISSGRPEQNGGANDEPEECRLY